MIRTHIEHLRGKSKEDLLDFVGRVLGLSRVEEISIKPDVITVRRYVESEATPVIPTERPEDERLDIPFLLTRLELEAWPLNTQAHSYSILTQIAQELSKKGLHPSTILVPNRDRELFSAWLGFTNYEEKHFMGFRIVYWDADQNTNEKIVVVGTLSSSGYLTDAAEGVVVDLV